MSEENRKISFRCPVHHCPSAIAHTYTKAYEPFVSLKIDGIFFEELTRENHANYYPIFPQNWKKIEGERYDRPNKPPIFYVFYIEVEDKKFSSLLEMYEEIENYFLSQISEQLTFDYLVSEDIPTDILNNVGQSFVWSDQFSDNNPGFIWWPKKYWPLNTDSWNNYIDKLDNIYKFVNSPTITRLITHDGLVISPNQPSNKKSLVKLKPRNELTIDLFFTGRDFTSRERTSYKYLIGQNSMVLVRNSVYRLAPDGKGKFIPVYKREIGKKPNPNNIIADIIHKYNNYFQISQLKDQYISPWYGEINIDGLAEVNPLFNYAQSIYNIILPHMSNGIVFDIGCGSMGQYAKHFVSNPGLTQYIGLDIDLAKLHEGQVKVKYGQKFAFMLMDITKKWNEQNDNFSNNLWRTYYHNLVKLNQKADNIISIFSSQYANLSKTSWNNYVKEINFRARSGTKIFIMWIDHSKLSKDSKNKYASYNSTNNELTVNLPHRQQHREPGLNDEIIKSFSPGSHRQQHREPGLSDEIIKSFVNGKDKWIIDEELMKSVNVDIDLNLSIIEYMKLINFIVMIKK